MLKKLTILIVMTVALFSSMPSYAADHIKIAQFGKERFLLYLPLYIAMEEGYFAKHGIEPELVFAGNDDQIFAAVASGSVDFGMGDPIFTAIAQEKGFPAKTIAMMITNLGVSGYTNNPEIPEIKSPKDLVGLRVGSFPKPSTTYTLLDEMRRNNHELTDLKIVEAPIGSQLGLLESNQVDIAIDLEPSVSVAEDNGYRVVYTQSNFSDNQVITGIMTTQDTINNKQDVVVRTVKALQEAMTALHNNPEIGLRVGKKILPDMKESIIKAALGRMMKNAMYPKSIVVDDKLWQRSIKTRLDSGDLKKPQATSVAVDNSFASAAQSK